MGRCSGRTLNVFARVGAFFRQDWISQQRRRDWLFLFSCAAIRLAGLVGCDLHLSRHTDPVRALELLAMFASTCRVLL
jgi:hypothetical protein